MNVVGPRGGEVIGDSPDRRVEILSDVDPLHATWSRFGPGRDGADLHIHREHTDLFYVLAGELTVRLGSTGDETAVPAGTLVRIPPYVVHGFRNAGAEELRYLNFHAPGCGFADYMRGLRDRRPVDFDQEDPPGEGLRPASDAVIGGWADEPAIAVEEIVGDLSPRTVAGVTSLYVLEGEAELTAGAERARLDTGTWAQVPAGVEHAVAGSAARYIVVRTPNG